MQGMVAMGAVAVKEGDAVVAVLSVASEQPGVLDRLGPLAQVQFVMQCLAPKHDVLLQLACKCLALLQFNSWLEFWILPEVRLD